MKRFTVQLLVVPCVAVLFLTSSAFAANTIKLGFADTYSGGAAIFGIDMRDGFRMGMNEINAKGGVLGKKLKWYKEEIPTPVALPWRKSSL